MQVRVIAEGVPTAVIRVPYNKGGRLFFHWGINSFQLNDVGGVGIVRESGIINQYRETTAREDGDTG